VRSTCSIAARFGDIWALPIRRRYSHVLLELGRCGERVLHIGAGDCHLAGVLGEAWGDVSYASCDIDTDGGHDFHALEDIPDDGTFDLIFGFEVIEHMTLEAAGAAIAESCRLLQPGGTLVLSTPNIFYPPGFLRDATHLTPFCYDELGALATLGGLEVESIYRLYHDSLVKKLLRRVVFYPVFLLLGIDFARQILLVARRPEANGG